MALKPFECKCAATNNVSTLALVLFLRDCHACTTAPNRRGVAFIAGVGNCFRLRAASRSRKLAEGRTF